MPNETAELLRRHGIQPSAQRLAIAEFVLHTDQHPSADLVLSVVRDRLPMISRATVYNTLNVLVEAGLLRQLALSEGRVVFDPKTERHHHFLDRRTGAIVDVPWSALRVSQVEALAERESLEIDDYQVVMHGRRLRRRPRS